ncbi:unnamed protein product, partial [Ceratitis capitata]
IIVVALRTLSAGVATIEHLFKVTVKCIDDNNSHVRNNEKLCVCKSENNKNNNSSSLSARTQQY